MLTDQELKQLLLDGESERVEFKESASDTKKIKQAICAFANDLTNSGKPGVILIGVNDNSACANLNIDDTLLTKLSDIPNNEITPKPSVTIHVHTHSGCKIVAMIVEPAFAPPVRYKGRVYIRIGASTQVASRDDERHLAERRRANDLPFDHQPAFESDYLNDLNLDFFKKTYLPLAISPDELERNGRTDEQQLTSLRFLSNDGKPTYGAILSFGKNPLHFVPGAYIQFVRFDGNELTDPIKLQKVLSGPLYKILENLKELLEINISTAIDITSADLEIRTPDYPIEALQQLIRNSIMHRNYESETNAPIRIYWFSDRIEISNPGASIIRETDFEKGRTAYRNPLIAEVMLNLRYVQRFGIGIATARKSLIVNGNPEPKFDFSLSDFFKVTIWKRP